MDCSKARDIIPQYCNGELDNAVRREFEKHISGCSECRDELKGEIELRQVISQSAADDPPEEYWEGYNAKIRSRARAATGMFWRLGLLPGCLAGGLIAFLITPVVLYLMFWLLGPNGARLVETEWLRSVLVVLIFLVVLAVTGLFARYVAQSVIMRINSQSMPRYERDETSLKRAVVSNLVYRRALMVVLMLAYTGYCVYFPIYAWGTWFNDMPIPRWAIRLFRDVMMVGFIASIPSFYLSLRAYLEGTHRLAEWGLKYRKAIKLANTLMYVGISTMLIAGLWSMVNMVR